MWWIRLSKPKIWTLTNHTEADSLSSGVAVTLMSLVYSQAAARPIYRSVSVLCFYLSPSPRPPSLWWVDSLELDRYYLLRILEVSITFSQITCQCLVLRNIVLCLVSGLRNSGWNNCQSEALFLITWLITSFDVSPPALCVLTLLCVSSPQSGHCGPRATTLAMTAMWFGWWWMAQQRLWGPRTTGGQTPFRPGICQQQEKLHSTRS